MITFARYAATTLYTPDAASAGGAGWLAFYLVPSGTVPSGTVPSGTVPSGTVPSGTPPPPTISVRQSWEEVAGYYLFLNSEPDNLDAFAEALAQFFHGVTPGRTGMAWLTYTPGGQPPIEGTVVHATEADAGVAVADPVQVQAGAIVMPFLPGTAMEPVISAEMGQIRGFRIVTPPTDSAGAQTPQSGEQTTPPAAEEVHIDLTGPERGCLRTTFGAERLAGAPMGQIGFYYFVQDGDTIVSQYYPVFEDYPPGVPTAMNAVVDPVAPYDPNRTYVALAETGDPLRQGIPDDSPLFGVIRSTFRTIYGETVGMVPIGAKQGGRPSRLVQQPLPPGSPQSFYLTLDGDFRMTVIPENGDWNSLRDHYDLLLGLSGLESVRFVPTTLTTVGNLMSFVPFQPAFVPTFPLIQPDGTAAPDTGTYKDPLLTDKYLTGWMTVSPPPAQPEDNVLYYAQLEGAPLYGDPSKQQEGDPNTPSFLPYLSTAAALLPPVAENACFPVAPIAWAEPATSAFGADFLRNLEFQILSPARRDQIRRFANTSSLTAQNAPAAASDTERDGTTPQGLLVNIDGYKWTELLLANSTDPATGAVQSLKFTNLNSIVQAAFQTNQQFLVVSWDKYLKEDGTQFENTIGIEGWPFFIDVGLSTIGNYKNVMIFKFGEGTVADRVQDTRLWTDPEHFNDPTGDNIAQLSKWLADYIAEARERAAHDEAFEHFNAIVHDPAWNGILALNVTIGLNEFPPELKGLLAGIDLDRFMAHHFGIEVSFVQPIGGGLEMAPQSSLFGLIDYTDKSLTQPQTQAVVPVGVNEPSLAETQFPPFYAAPYEFVVLTLKVQFTNSQIKNFTSTVKLTVNQLFGEVVKNADDTDPNANAIILDGIYEDHSGTRVYVFNIRERKTYEFIGKVVDTVEIVKAQFSTIQTVDTAGQTGQADEIVQSVFSFWGTMSFHNVAADFDVFSFDSLNYAAMKVEMSFALSNPGSPVFVFNPGTMTFDMVGSVARDNSVFRNFPLRLQGIAFGESNRRPVDTGFLNVKTPLVGYSNSLDNNWYALAFSIDLGTPGALAAKIGFTALLYVAWSPVFDPRRNNSIAVNLKLPRGGGDQNMLSLQGVLSLSIRSITFNTTIDNDTGARAFLLVFERIALKALGVSLPPGASLDAVLFGNPEPDATPGSLGWYFAYNKT